MPPRYASGLARPQGRFWVARGAANADNFQAVIPRALYGAGLAAALFSACASGPSLDGTPRPGNVHRAAENTQGNRNAQPSASSKPWVDDFYDPAYEESLYSPFSFN